MYDMCVYMVYMFVCLHVMRSIFGAAVDESLMVPAGIGRGRTEDALILILLEYLQTLIHMQTYI